MDFVAGQKRCDHPVLSNTLGGVRVPDIYGFPPGMLLVFTLSMTPLMFIYLYGAMEKIDGALLEASELMGFVGIRKVVRIVLPPLILPTVLAGVLVVFMRVFSDYATPMLIGEGYRTVPVLIVNEFIGELGGDSGFAAAISVSVILFATTIFLLQKYVSSRKSFVMSALNPVRPKQETGGIKNVLAHLYVYLFTLLTLFPPIFTLYIRRFARHRGTCFCRATPWIISAVPSAERQCRFATPSL